MVKVQRKASGCFRSLAGAHAFSRVRGSVPAFCLASHSLRSSCPSFTLANLSCYKIVTYYGDLHSMLSFLHLLNGSSDHLFERNRITQEKRRGLPSSLPLVFLWLNGIHDTRSDIITNKLNYLGANVTIPHLTKASVRERKTNHEQAQQQRSEHDRLPSTRGSFPTIWRWNRFFARRSLCLTHEQRICMKTREEDYTAMQPLSGTIDRTLL
jgi:hypothetical protein